MSEQKKQDTIEFTIPRYVTARMRVFNVLVHGMNMLRISQVGRDQPWVSGLMSDIELTGLPDGLFNVEPSPKLHLAQQRLREVFYDWLENELLVDFMRAHMEQRYTIAEPTEPTEK